MYSRMIHDIKGRTGAVPYGKKDQCILSIDRRFLNELLLNGYFFIYFLLLKNFFVIFSKWAEAEKYPNIKVLFSHKLIKCNTNTGALAFEKYHFLFRSRVLFKV